MSNEFDAEDFDLDAEFGDDFSDFEDFESEDDELMVRTVVMGKEDMIALLCIKSASEGAAICRVDPRESMPSVQVYDDPEAALHWFTKSLRTSRKNGWRLIYDGLPLQG